MDAFNSAITLFHMDSSIPKEAPAAVKHRRGSSATTSVQNVPVEQPGPGQLLIRITWTGLCASDKSLLRDEWSGFRIKQTEGAKGIAGHEDAGAVVFSASRESYAVASKCLRPGGTMIAVSLPKETDVMAGASPLVMAMNRLNVVGSVTGTLKDVEECLEFTARGLVHPILTKGTLYDLDRFCDMIGAGQLVGRAVMKVGA